MKGRKLINRRGMLGAAIAEYLPLLSLILLIVVGGVVQYAEELRKHAANVSEELAGEGGIGDVGIGGPGGAGGGGSGSGGPSTPGGTSGGGTGGSSGGDVTTPTGPGGTTTGPGDSSGSTPGDSLVDVDTPPATPGDTPSEGGGTGEESAMASIGRFIEGLWDGVKTQFWGLAEMLLSPIETATNLKELAVSFVTDPKGTIEVVISELKEDFDALTSEDPYEVGRVIGENVSPAALAGIAGKLAKLSRTPAAIAKRDSVAKELDEGCSKTAARSSFVAGTLVWTAKGFLPIEQLVIGDVVITRDDKTFDDSPQAVTQLHTREVTRYYELDTGYEKIPVTEEHPFWQQGKGWISAEKLKVGDVLARAEGDIQIHEITLVQGAVRVYNLTVDKTHTYFVGPNKLWVHNCSLDAPATDFDVIKSKIPKALQAEFEADVKGTDLQRNFERNPDLANSWLLAKDHPQIRKNMDALLSISILRADKDVMDVLGADGLKDVLKAVKNPLEDSDTSFVKLPLDKHLLNIQDFIHNHKDVPGFDKVIADLKNTGINTQKGITHTLNAIKDYEPGSIKAFDLTFEGDGLPCPGCRFDVELDGKIRLAEFKSYALDSIPNIPLPQFKNYIKSVNSMDEFRYYFNKLDTPNVADVKSKFKQVFNKDPEGIFETMSPDLKDELSIKDVDELMDLVNDTSSELYDFIEVK